VEAAQAERVRIQHLVAGGDGFARADDGRVVFVAGALPGELVDVSIVDDRRDFARARVVAIVEPSADRVEPACEHRRVGCGGCGWMHLDVEAQFTAKLGVVAESLRRIGRFDSDEVDQLIVRGRAVDPAGYRTTIRVVGLDDGIGFREEGSDAVVPIDSCLVAHPRLAELLPELRVRPGVELTLRTSVATGGTTALWSVPTSKRRSGRRPAPTTDRDGDGGGARPVEGLPRWVHIGPRAFLTERIDGIDLRVSAPSFFQPGAAAAEALVAAVGTAVPEAATADHLVDAYGGVGLFAATVGRHAAHVTLVESSRTSTADAGLNLGERARIERSEFARWARSRHPEARQIDAVIADPARSGLGKPGVKAVDTLDAPVVALVSCDPVSMARDAALLTEVGYRPERIEVIDLFPQTPHVEVVTRFTRHR